MFPLYFLISKFNKNDRNPLIPRPEDPGPHQNPTRIHPQSLRNPFHLVSFYGSVVGHCCFLRSL